MTDYRDDRLSGRQIIGTTDYRDDRLSGRQIIGTTDYRDDRSKFGLGLHRTPPIAAWALEKFWGLGRRVYCEAVSVGSGFLWRDRRSSAARPALYISSASVEWPFSNSK